MGRWTVINSATAATTYLPMAHLALSRLKFLRGAQELPATTADTDCMAPDIPEPACNDSPTGLMGHLIEALQARTKHVCTHDMSPWQRRTPDPKCSPPPALVQSGCVTGSLGPARHAYPTHIRCILCIMPCECTWVHCRANALERNQGSGDILLQSISKGQWYHMCAPPQPD